MYAFLRANGGAAAKSRVIEEGMRFVPAGPANREGTRKRLADARYRNYGVEGELRNTDSLSLFRAGANKLVCNSLYYERKAGRIREFEGPDGRPWLGVVEPATE